jgi:polysaccharide pyruvyl transferase WcaK-like protein
MKVLLLGDIGSVGGYHAGDEAMAEAVVEQLGSRGDVDVVAISGDVADTISRYGWRAVPRIDFAAPLTSDAERDARLDAVLCAARGDTNAIPWSDPAWTVIHAVADADAVVISGGGNLSSTWPEHIYERAALAQLAAIFNKRHVVTGQTVGPHLTARHGELVGRILTSAALVGARESSSHSLALQLGVLPDRLVHVLDDAVYLRESSAEVPQPAGPYIAATFSPDAGLVEPDIHIAAVATFIDDVVRMTGLRVALVPHLSSGIDGNATGDLAMHTAVAERVSSSVVEVLAPLDARQIQTITHGAALVISTRYHPVVFALGASVPALGIAVDAYTSIEIRGAMDIFGVGDFAVPAVSLAHGGALAAVLELVDRSDDVVAHLKSVNAVRTVESAAWWDAVDAVLRGDAATEAPRDLAPAAVFHGGEWTGTCTALREWSDSISVRVGADQLESARAYTEVATLEAKIDALEREAAALAADLSTSADEVDALRLSAKAAYALVSEPLRPIATWLEDLPSIEKLRAELDAVYRTRTFRLLDRPRRLYSKLRA